MITSGLVVDGVSHGLQAHLPYNHQAVHNHHRMSYVEPSAYMKSVGPPPPSPQQQQQQQQQSSELPSTPEFLRPLPKPAPVNPLKAPRASSKYAVDCRPVNLTAPKEPLPPPSVDHHIRMDERHHPYMYGHPRLYVSAAAYHPYHNMHQPPAPYGVYTSPYAPVIPRDTRHHLMQPPQERRYPSPPNKNGGVNLGSRASPSSSPPEQFKVPNGRDNKPPLQLQQQRILPPPQPATTVATAPAVNHNNNINNNNINNNNNHIGAVAEPSPKKLRRNTPEPLSPPAAKTSNFTKGSLIRLANGNIKKVEDMRTEDFLNSVENSDLHRIDPSTVVRIEPVTDSAVKGNIKITLSYGDQRNQQIGSDNKKTNSVATIAAATSKSHQVEMESGAEHPYFVFGRGWASWSPAKTLAKYGLTCQRLQVGDVCVSLTKRSSAVASDLTTTTTTTPPHGKRRQQHSVSVAVQQQQQNLHHLHQHHSTAAQKAQLQLQQQSVDDDKNSRNKRRWSAPDPEPGT
ncbi:serine/threonine-protein kinase pakB isoform X2 [Acyrthosiphon pisum]|nr:serine/threonine-protein kinase pakB isoform X2 [Acyrthosiphon pisum]|eukprot:XP_001950618.2 PREDICTED: serine/threonine-protein kinase pakB [Acyrthosiphon pisum]